MGMTFSQPVGTFFFFEEEETESIDQKARISPRVKKIYYHFSIYFDAYRRPCSFSQKLYNLRKYKLKSHLICRIRVIHKLPFTALKITIMLIS